MRWKKALTMEEAYKTVEWKIIVLLAGLLTLGVALGKTGAALLLSKWLIATVGSLRSRRARVGLLPCDLAAHGDHVEQRHCIRSAITTITFGIVLY